MSGVRTTLSETANRAQMSIGRESIREMDDGHLLQQIKKADVSHSETPSDFERFQMVGMTAVPLKQDEDKQQQSQSKGGDKSGSDWDHDQPKGKSAEAVMLYPGGQRSHPIAMVDDRRVRPYAMKPGQAAFYSAYGSEQIAFHKDDGFYLVSLDGPSYGSKDNKTRMVSLRHVNKKLQPREIKKGETAKEHKHEGESVNMEVQVTASRINFVTGTTTMGFIEKSSQKLYWGGATTDGMKKVKLEDDSLAEKLYAKSE